MSGLLPSTTPPPKFSRYRSVRQTNAPPQESIPSLPNVSTEQFDMQRTKSMSRYRRSKIAFQINDQEAPPLPSHSPALAYTKSPSGGKAPNRSVTDPIRGQEQYARSSPHQSHSLRNSNSQAELQVLMASKQTQSHSQYRNQETEDERLRRKIREFREREAAKATEQQKARKERDEQERAYQLQQANVEHALQKKRSQANQAEQMIQKQNQEAEQARRAQVEAANALEEQKKKDLERLQRELDAAAPPVRSPKFGFFSRKSSSSKEATSPSTDGSVSKSEASKKSREISSRSPQKQVNPPTPVISQAPRNIVEVPQQIQQGGGGIVPQTDAPISASNAGERRVLVRCKQSSVNLPVNPETTPKEIIYSAANFMTQPIIPSTAIMIECYNQLGLERRIRRYEHVRDVMNSWDRDTQNSFRLENSDTPKFDTDLELSGVPKEIPADVTVYMYHSQKPGVWVKRHITLLSTGQVYIHKKADAKLGDKHTLAICHLSDFDVYSITPQQLRKGLKAPKKHCYAVKSQQKPAVFLSTENFVHFFSTDDESVADTWYTAVQSWRSWYLVNKMGGGEKKSKFKFATSKTASKANNGGSALLAEVEDEPYMIGTFTSLGLEDFKSGSDEDFDSEDESRPRQIPFHLRNSIIMTPAELKREAREAKRHPPPVSYRLPSELSSEEGAGDFSSTGLLGRTYTTRQAQVTAKPPSTSSGPFTEGINLLNRNQTQDSTTTRTISLTNTSGLTRSNSRTKLKPLLDFTPTFKEAPQWAKSGKGHGVAPIKGVPLVEVATTPENPLGDLLGVNATVFRREGGAAVGNGRPVTREGPTGSVVQRGRVRYDS